MRTYRPFQKIVAVVVAFVAVLAFSAASACATEPWWHVNTVSAPASQPGGESRLVLEVSNLGDAAVEGSSNPVTIVDRLPAGVTVLTNARHEPEIYPEGGGSLGRHRRCQRSDSLRLGGAGRDVYVCGPVVSL